MSRFQKVLLLKIEHGEKTSEKVYDLSTLIIGRSTDSHIGIADPGVSRHHLEISLKHGRVWLTDLDSANGSFINGQKIDSKTKIAYHDGEFIHVGSQRVKIIISVVEKAFDLKDISTSGLDSNEKENLMTLVNSAHAEADRINHMVKGETDQSIRATEAKINNLISQANFQADQIISTANNNASKIQEEAQRKHSETVLKAENDAFAATAEVFRKAEQATLDSEEKAKQILIHADKLSQEKYNKSEEDAALLIQQARLRVQELRLDWEKEMQLLTEEMTLRANQKEEDAKLRAEEIASAADRQKLIVLNQANELFDIAKKEAQERAVQYYAQAEAELKAAQKKSQEILIEAQQEVKNLLLTAEQDSQLKKKEILNNASDLANLKMEETEAFLLAKTTDTEAFILAKTTAADEKLKSLNELISASENESIIQNEKLNLIKIQLKENEELLLETVDELNKNKRSVKDFKDIVSDLTLQRKTLLEELNLAKNHLAETMAQRKNAVIESDLVKQDAERLKNQIENECKDLKDQARKEIESFKARENDLLDKRKLEEIKILKELRLQSDRNLNRHKSELVNEFLRLTESHILTFLKPALPQTFNWQDVTQKLQTEVKDTLNEAIYRFTNVETHKESQDITHQKATLFIKRFKKFGLSATAVLTLALSIPASRSFIFDFFKQDNVNTGAQIFSQQMQTERARRFEPTKSDEWRENYTDALLYTKGFADLKLTPTYQDKWIRDLHEYLYTKLRVDEDSIVKLVSLEAAMVTKLKEEADSIHPDYVDQQVSKMRSMESESIAQMQKLIGSDKKFEQFRKFSEQYYYQEFLKRAPAQTTK